MNILDGFEKMINGKLKGDIVVVKKSANVSMSWHFLLLEDSIIYTFSRDRQTCTYSPCIMKLKK